MEIMAVVVVFPITLSTMFGTMVLKLKPITLMEVGQVTVMTIGVSMLLD